MTDWVLVVLTAGMLQFGNPYSDQETCEIAAEKLAELDQAAVCMPAGDVISPREEFQLNILDLMQRLIDLEVDKLDDSYYN